MSKPEPKGDYSIKVYGSPIKMNTWGDSRVQVVVRGFHECRVEAGYRTGQEQKKGNKQTTWLVSCLLKGFSERSEFRLPFPPDCNDSWITKSP